jgi:hypothetical protein
MEQSTSNQLVCWVVEMWYSCRRQVVAIGRHEIDQPDLDWLMNGSSSSIVLTPDASFSHHNKL